MLYLPYFFSSIVIYIYCCNVLFNQCDLWSYLLHSLVFIIISILGEKFKIHCTVVIQKNALNVLLGFFERFSFGLLFYGKI